MPFCYGNLFKSSAHSMHNHRNFPLFATCLSVQSHNSQGTATFSRFAFLLCFTDFLCPSFPPLSPAFFIYLYVLSFLSLFPFVYNALLALTHSFLLPTLPGCSFDLWLSCFIWRPIKEGASGPLCMEPGSSTRAGASEPSALHTAQ